MDATEYFQTTVATDGDEYAVYRFGGNTTDTQTYRNTSDNGTGNQKVGTVTMATTDVSGESSVVVEGSEQNVSTRGIIKPQYDQNGQLTSVVEVNDELHHTQSPHKYVVRTKVGKPNHTAVEVWHLGLDRAITTD
jgi:hypothetical protein